MKTAPVSEGRLAATRGESLSGFPLGRGSWIPRELLEREPLTVAVNDDAGTVAFDSKVAFKARGMAGVVMATLTDLVAGRGHARVRLAVRARTHLVPPIRGTLTHRAYAPRRSDTSTRPRSDAATKIEVFFPAFRSDG